MNPERLLDEIYRRGAKIVVGAEGVKLRTPSPLPDDLVEEIRRQKLEVVVAMHGVTLAELRDLAGEDWPELEADPALLKCYADMVAIRKMRESGRVPPSYTATTICAHCGPVPIFPGVAKRVAGCPWCLNRAVGRPVPTVEQP
jgi:hypothetical protein